MEKETLFTSSKWEILKLLAEKKMSPLELAKEANTSMANISQQLRLLEMAGLVTSKRISNRDKGKPRIIYSLKGNTSYIITMANQFTEKKFFKLSRYNKIVLKIWFLERPEMQYFLEKLFWSIEKHLDDVSAIYLDLENQDILLHVVPCNGTSLKKYLMPQKVKNGSSAMDVKFNFLNREQLHKKDASQIYQLYDPEGMTVSG